MSTFTPEQSQQLSYIDTTFPCEKDFQCTQVANGWLIVLVKRYHDDGNVEAAKRVENVIATTTQEVADIVWNFILHGVIPTMITKREEPVKGSIDGEQDEQRNGTDHIR